MIRVLFAAGALLATISTGAAEPKTCSEALDACMKPFGRTCDQGCQATCKMRFNGCIKTGSFSTPGKLMQNLRRN